MCDAHSRRNVCMRREMPIDPMALPRGPMVYEY